MALGQRNDLVEIASGPSATFNIDDLENSVAFSRDISDVYGIDPRLMIDIDEDGFGINCAGKHPRFNNVTLDGVSTGDRFGLNENGYSTAVGMPFPYDAIEQIAVELAPFRRHLRRFLGLQHQLGDEVRHQRVGSARRSTSTPTTTFAATRSGRYRRLFASVLRQDLSSALTSAARSSRTSCSSSPPTKNPTNPRFLAKGYAGFRQWRGASLAQQGGLSTASLSIAQNVYGYDPGGQPGDGMQEAEKYMVRLDWNINDTHNAAFIYSYFDGFQLTRFGR